MVNKKLRAVAMWVSRSASRTASRTAERYRFISSRKICGLVIDESSIRIAGVKGDRATVLAETELEPGLVKDGIVTLPAEVAPRLRKLLDDHKLGRARIIVGVTGLHSLTRIITLPPLPPKGLAEAVRRESERELPVPIDTLHISWQVLSRDANEVKVFFAACGRSAVDSIWDTLKRAGIRPRMADLAPLALAGACQNKSAMLIDVRPHELDIVTISGGVPVLIRSIPGVPADGDVIRFVAEEVERTMKYHQSALPESDETRDVPLYLSWGLQKGSNADAALGARLNVPVVSGRLPFTNGGQPIPPRYTLNLGLALKRAKPRGYARASLVNLNILPEAYRPKKPSAYAIATPAGSVVAIALVVATILQMQHTSAQAQELKTQAVQAEYLAGKIENEQAALKKKTADLQKSIDRSLAAQKNLQAAARTIAVRQEQIPGDLQVTVLGAPSSVAVNELKLGSKEAVVAGASGRWDDILAYAGSLTGSGRFSETVIEAMSKQPDGSIDFQLWLSKGK